MQEEGIEAPDEVTFANAIRACGGLFALDEGLELHHKVISCGFELVTDVVNALIWFHASCDRVKDSRQVFDNLAAKDSVSWNEMVLGYARKAYSHQAFMLFADMTKEGIMPDESTCSALLRRCASMGSITLSWGRRIHASILEWGLNRDTLLANELVAMYSNCGSNLDSQLVRCRMRELNIKEKRLML
jgi:pentatricopeptide repeat protein